MIYLDYLINIFKYLNILLKAISLDNLKKHQEALEFYEKALDIEPNNPAMLTNKGVCLNNLKMYDEALVIKMKK
jgi:tetratricopeptide (TPR) repeat protein